MRPQQLVLPNTPLPPAPRVPEHVRRSQCWTSTDLLDFVHDLAIWATQAELLLRGMQLIVEPEKEE